MSSMYRTFSIIRYTGGGHNSTFTKLSHRPMVRGHPGHVAEFGHSLPCCRQGTASLSTTSFQRPFQQPGFGTDLKTEWDSRVSRVCFNAYMFLGDRPRRGTEKIQRFVHISQSLTDFYPLTGE